MKKFFLPVWSNAFVAVLFQRRLERNEFTQSSRSSIFCMLWCQQIPLPPNFTKISVKCFCCSMANTTLIRSKFQMKFNECYSKSSEVQILFLQIYKIHIVQKLHLDQIMMLMLKLLLLVQFHYLIHQPSFKLARLHLITTCRVFSVKFNENFRWRSNVWQIH